MRPDKEPSSYEGDEELGRQLFHHTQHSSLYDEVGNALSEFGWFAITYFERIPYIVSYVNGSFWYKQYATQKAVCKAWDYVCDRHEKWYTRTNEND